MIATAPLSIGRVALTVHDLSRVRDFYQQAVGLQLLDAQGPVARLGADGRVLLELREDTAAPRHSPHDAGLFHTAFLLPTRADLGGWVRHAAEAGLTLQGASDHRVSEAIYLADPEGNGIEIYADRPRAEWRWSDGIVSLSNDPLDLQQLIADAGPQIWQGFPDGSVIGHVHLQVGAIPAAEAFYAGLLGFAITSRYPGGTFYSTGLYHHHIATNIWNSRGASVRAERSTGLADVELIAADARLLDAIRARAGIAGHGAAVSLSDPWGTSISVVTR